MIMRCARPVARSFFFGAASAQYFTPSAGGLGLLGFRAGRGWGGWCGVGRDRVGAAGAPPQLAVRGWSPILVRSDGSVCGRLGLVESKPSPYIPRSLGDGLA